MPYVKQEEREKFYETLATMPDCRDAGELNFFLSAVVTEYILRLKEAGAKVNYVLLNNVDGVLGQVQAEFRRRVIAPYEDKKIADNGDVYGGIL